MRMTAPRREHWLRRQAMQGAFTPDEARRLIWVSHRVDRREFHGDMMQAPPAATILFRSPHGTLHLMDDTDTHWVEIPGATKPFLCVTGEMFCRRSSTPQDDPDDGYISVRWDDAVAWVTCAGCRARGIDPRMVRGSVVPPPEIHGDDGCIPL